MFRRNNNNSAPNNNNNNNNNENFKTTSENSNNNSNNGQEQQQQQINPKAKGKEEKEATTSKTVKTKRAPRKPISSNFSKDLDSWLENCLRDADIPQLSSSSEFLELNIPSLNFNRKSQAVPNVMNTIPMERILREVHLSDNEGNMGYASLPPMPNVERFDEVNFSRKLSDPYLAGQFGNGNNSKRSSTNSPETPKTSDNNMGNQKILATLLEQVNLLHKTNSKICKNLHDTKVELEQLKHASHRKLKHTDSLSGLSSCSQPMGMAFSTHSSAPTYYSGKRSMYSPGLTTDIVREVKEAARVREEALLERIKAMVEERAWSQGEGNLRLVREIEDLRVQLQHLKTESKEANLRISHLEAENKYIRSLLGSILDKIALTEEIRGKRTSEYELSINEPEKIVFDNSSMKMQRVENEKQQGHYFISESQVDITSSNVDKESSNSISPIHSDKYLKKRLNSTQLLQEEKETLDLRRELQEALACKQQAESRIIALETLVKRLQDSSKKSHSKSCIDVPSSHNINVSNTNSINRSNSSNEFSSKLLNLSSGSTIGGNGASGLEDGSITGTSTSQARNLSSKFTLTGPITDL